MSVEIAKFEQEQIKKLVESRKEADFAKDVAVGDTVNVKYVIREGNTTRIQALKGVVIAKTKDISHYSATFTVRKISSGVGVERKFAFFSPLLVGVEVLKRGTVRRAKLYYLRNLTGKASRIEEKMEF